MSTTLPVERPITSGLGSRELLVSESAVSAAELRLAFDAAERWLLANRDGINAINVYPVPDGDTGTNMLLTLRAALRGIDDGGYEGPYRGVGPMMRQMSRAALLGARGNSGVILSQMIRGLAEALDGNAAISRGDLIRAMCHASDTAYAAVSNPVEGTMLTVLREAATLAQDHLDAGADEEAILQALVDEAYASVERTPDLLPRLREAGVIDAGGAGVAVILDGIARQLSGSPLPDVPRYAATEEVQTEAMEHEGHGYCTEFIIHGDGLDLQQIERGLAEAGGDSLLVVGDAQTVHVHVHMEDPGPALSIGARTGALSGVKVEDMQAQHEEWMAARDAESSAAPPPQSVGLVAIVAGAGLGAAFRDLGAGVVIELDGTTKASAGEILAAARRAGRDHAIILPNDRDILMAAETAAREAEGFLTAIPSANVAAGLAAAIYFRPGGAVDDLVDQMTSALADVICIEVSTAVRDATVDGIAVRSGDAIALVDGRMQHTAPTHDDALIEALASGVAEGASLITVYLGADAAAETGARIEQLIAELFPAIEVEVLPGGQPHYVYIASVE
ncbi:MAG: DAK2 domain-containing protein [Chloroflexi bacterium]|nr:DAK2 domain-containing protein [Chloroflexota bacterium]